MDSGQPAPPLWMRLYLWATERLYHEFAWAYDAVSWLVSLGRWHRWRCLALEHVVGTPILEVGCGTGALLVNAARRGMVVTGLERSPEMIGVAGRRRRRHSPGVALVRGDAVAMPFAAHSFDTVLSTFPSGYIAQAEALREISRVLRQSEGEGLAPRLVIAGLLVETDNRLLALLPWLAPAGSTGRAQSLLVGRAHAAGLTLSVRVHRDGLVRVPVFILEKQHAA